MITWSGILFLLVVVNVLVLCANPKNSLLKIIFMPMGVCVCVCVCVFMCLLPGSTSITNHTIIISQNILINKLKKDNNSYYHNTHNNVYWCHNLNAGAIKQYSEP